MNVFSRRFLAGVNKDVTFLGRTVKASILHKKLGHLYEEVLSTMLKDCQQYVSVDILHLPFVILVFLEKCASNLFL